MNIQKCTLLIIGAGPGGYVAAIRAGQLGLDTVVIEAAAPGGACLNVGCIPSKALIHAADEFDKVRHCQDENPLGISTDGAAIDLAKMLAWKDGIVTRLTGGVSALLKKAGVRRINGWARFIDGKTVEVESDGARQVITAEHVVIATGSSPVELESVPFGGPVISSTEALSLSSVPGKLVIVGAGYIGLELGMAYAKLGAEVAIVEADGRILPSYDRELTAPVAKRLKVLGVPVYLNARAQGLSEDGSSLMIETADGARDALRADKVLVTAGRKPVTEGWGIENLALEMDGPFIKIDDQCRTAMRGVYAIGDVTGEPMLAHRAMAQGEMVAEIIAGHRRVWDKRAIPAVCFTDPEIVTVGLSPDEAEAELGRREDVIVAQFPFSANGRAMTMQAEDGFVRIVARGDNHLVLGLQAVGAGASELSASFSLALEMGARAEDLAETIHAHPTLSEALPEAALRALGAALHI